MKQIKNLLFAQWLIINVAITVSSLQAAYEFQGVGWAAAAANIRVVGDQHADRLMVNPSLMGTDIQPYIGIQYYRPFLGLDLQAGSFEVLYQLGSRPMISGLQYFGDEFYSEFLLTSGTSWSLNSEFYTGISLNIFQLSLANFETRMAISMSTSMSFKLSSDIRLGSVMQHVLQRGKSLMIPQRFLFGGEYDGGPLVLMFSVEKEAALPLELCVALITSSARKWQVAIGYRDLSQSISAGWRFRFGNLGLHYSAVLHADLPISHGFGLELLFP